MSVARRPRLVKHKFPSLQTITNNSTCAGLQSICSSLRLSSNPILFIPHLLTFPVLQLSTKLMNYMRCMPGCNLDAMFNNHTYHCCSVFNCSLCLWLFRITSRQWFSHILKLQMGPEMGLYLLHKSQAKNVQSGLLYLNLPFVLIAPLAKNRHRLACEQGGSFNQKVAKDFRPFLAITLQ